MLKAAGLAAVAVLALVSCGHHTRMASYRDPGDGWEISYPASMHPAVVDEFNGVRIHGVVIANAPVRRSDRRSFEGLPAKGAAFAMLQMQGGPGPNPSIPKARFPLRRSDFERTGSAPFPSPFIHGMILNGGPWAVYAWFGEKASHRDQERIWRIVESLRSSSRSPVPAGGG